jgi:methanogenic corrinoid protein MtbC1
MQDRVSFVDVTVGTARIVAMLPGLANLTRPSGGGPGLSVVFASVPGEQHTLGVRMATEQFRCDGWDVALRIGLTQDELVSEIERLPKCILGLSIGGKHALKPISRLAVALERSCPNASIVVSGHEIEEIRPQLLSMGLSNIAHEIYEAKVKISALWDQETSTRLD